MLARRGNFKKYVDWVLLQCRSPYNIGESVERNSAPDAATSSATDQPEPTTDVELEPAIIAVPVSKTEPKIIPEPEPN